MTEETFKTHTSDWRLSCYASPPLQSIQQTMNQAIRNFRASVPCMWIRDIHLIHKEITGLSQVTWADILWPPDNPLSNKKLAYMCVCVCELPLRTFYVRSFNNICAKHKISDFHNVNVRILIFWNGTLSSRVTDSRSLERTSGINKPDSVNYPEEQSSMHSDLFSTS
jgi:hypothetical protein